MVETNRIHSAYTLPSCAGIYYSPVKNKRKRIIAFKLGYFCKIMYERGGVGVMVGIGGEL